MLGFKIPCSGSFKKNAKIVNKLLTLGVKWSEGSDPQEVQAPPDYVICVIKDKVGKEIVYTAFIRLEIYGLCHLKTISKEDLISAKTLTQLHEG